MKVSYTIIAIAGLASVAAAQETPGPSPTNSVGCEPHGDHWHCDGPISTPTAAIPSVTNPAAPSTSSTEAHEHDHEHEHDNEHDHEDGHDHEGEEHDDTTGSGTLPPSPTESAGCVPHEDHWHCDGPAAVASGAATGSTTGTATGTATRTSTGTITIAPSPTESIGCEPHGDHWHCDGPAVTSSSLTRVAPNRTIPAASTSATSTLVPASGAAVQGGTGHGFVVALLVLAGLFAL